MATTYAAYADTPVYMYPAALTYRSPSARQRTIARAPANARATATDVCDLIDAAGPLSVTDIAGGLDVKVSEAAATVEWLLANGRGRLDEWGRLRVAA